MHNKSVTIGGRFKQYMHRTYKNKLAAIGIVVVGLVVFMLEWDVTLLILGTLFAVPLFFTRKDWFAWPDE